MACECLLGQLGRLLVFTLLGGGCLCAYLSASSCEFFSYQSKQPQSLPGPFFNVTSASVGIFGYYSANNNSDIATIDGTCTRYSENFMNAMDDNEFNSYFVTAQFAAIIGPGCAAMAWLINLIEWLLWSNTCTYQLVVMFLIFSFAMQGITFMIYAQKEFCFDDRISEDCKMQFGAYMSIAATAAFYCTSIVWCCMPRSPPFCIAKGNKGIDKAAAKNSKDYDEFYAANTFETTNTNPPQELENSNDYFSPAPGETKASPWADSDNRPPIPQTQPVADAYLVPATSESVVSQPQPQPQPTMRPMMYPSTSAPPMHYQNYQIANTAPTMQPPLHNSMPASMPGGGWQDHTAEWTSHDVSNPMNATHEEPFANPFVMEEPMAGAVSSSGRPAYGNLQG